MNDSEMINLWNEYCDNNRYYDDRIEYFDEGVFNDLMSGKTPYEIYQIIDNGDISFFDNFDIDELYNKLSNEDEDEDEE